MRLIDADVLRAVKFHALPYTHIHALGAEPQSYEMGWNDAVDAIMDCAPTVDAVEVVRCKDCVYCKRFNDVWYLPKKDELLCTLHVETYHTDENDYCSWGEREDNGKID